MTTTKVPLRVLLVEDSDDDAALVLRELRRGDFDVTMERVQTAPSLETALAGPHDVVLSDYTMPTLDAPTALAIVRAHDVDLPFIVVSGTVGEDAAVEVMRAGANDYLLKGNLSRLGPAITREIRDGRARAERRLADRVRQKAEESFRLIIESSPDLIVVHRDGVIVYANPTTRHRLGWGDATVNGEPLSAIVIEDAVRGTRRPAREGGSAATVEERWRCRDGQAIAVEVVHGDVAFEGEAAKLAMARDLTDRNQILAAMVEMDRMATIGTLAAGIGHEINNPLAYVLANLEFVTSELEVVVGELPPASYERLEPRIRDMIQALADTNHGAQRVRAIVGDLRTFSRADDAVLSNVDVRQVLDASVRMAAVQLRQRATIVRNYGEVRPVIANESRLGQVFLNLIVNAAHALPEGLPSENRIVLGTREEGDSVVVEVCDTGTGIPSDVMPRIFEPFFTTKNVGQGTGLGLSICRRIVTQLGGDISVTSDTSGTTFVVRLPRPPPEPERAARAPSAPPEPRESDARRARILCVDDEPALGIALKRVMVTDHDVVVTTSAHEALERVKAGEHFDVVLCDLMMPTMTGMDFHRELARLDPALADKVVFLSGGAFTAGAREFLDAVPNLRLAKPIGAEALRSAIEGVLSR